MKKIILLLPIMLVMLATTGCSSNKKNDLTSENIKGNVKTIEQTTYKAQFVDSVATKMDTVLLLSKAEFDNKGFKTNFSEYEGDGRVKAEYKFKYNKNGQRIESLMFNENGEPIGKLVHSYDGKENTQTDNFNADGEFLFRYTYPKDVEEGTLQTIVSDKNGEMTYKYVLTLDDKGNHKTMIIYDENGDAYSNSTFDYQFDHNDNWILMTEIMDNNPRSITLREIVYY